LLAKQIATRRLPENRWHRALQFAPIGLGVGLIATIALAVLRIAAPHGTVWFPLLVVPAAGAFLLGYVAPGPLGADETETDPPDESSIARAEGTEDAVIEPASPALTNDDPRATRPAGRPHPLVGSSR
jgi:hypothetical protein